MLWHPCRTCSGEGGRYLTIAKASIMLGSPSSMNSHCHPLYPNVEFRDSSAAARGPAITFDKEMPLSTTAYACIKCGCYNKAVTIITRDCGLCFVDSYEGVTDVYRIHVHSAHHMDSIVCREEALREGLQGTGFDCLGICLGSVPSQKVTYM